MEKKQLKKGKDGNPFEDYMWMENMEEFDRQIKEQLWEEEFIRTCIEQLLDEEEERETMTAAEILSQQQLENLHITNPNPKETGQQPLRNGLNGNTNGYSNGVDAQFQRVLSSSKLNPNAKVFVPSGQGVRTSS